MLRRGQTTAEIAGRLEITPVTVRRHISELVHKFGVTGRSDLLAAPRRREAEASVSGSVQGT
jgi:DNA-binding CsgD family transcriptional regulator